MSLTQYDELRAAMHQKLREDPPRFLKTILGVSRDKDASHLEKIFTQCAFEAGCAVNGDVQDYVESGRVPDYVLQCCSGRMCKVKPDELDRISQTD